MQITAAHVERFVDALARRDRKAAVRQALGKDSLAGVHIAIQGAGSVASTAAR